LTTKRLHAYINCFSLVLIVPAPSLCAYTFQKPFDGEGASERIYLLATGRPWKLECISAGHIPSRGAATTMSRCFTISFFTLRRRFGKENPDDA